MESSLKDLAIGTIRLASLSLLPNAASTLSPASTSCSRIKGRIVLAFFLKEKKELKGGKIRAVQFSVRLGPDQSSSVRSSVRAFGGF